MSLTIWRKIAFLRRGREPLAWWRVMMEADFEKVRPFLVPCEGLAGTYTYGTKSRVRLTIRESHGGAYRGIPTGEDCDATDDVVLSWEEAQAWEVRHDLVRDALAGAFGLAAAAGAADPAADVHLVGICERNGGRRPVYLCHATNTENAVRLAADAGRTPDAGCILLPERELAAEHVLNGRGVAGVPLAECVTWADGKWVGACGEGCKKALGCRLKAEGETADGADGRGLGVVSGRLRAKRAAAGRRRSVVNDLRDRKAIRAEVKRVIGSGLPHTEAFRQVAEQAQLGRAGQRKLTMKYNVSPTEATASVVRRLFESDW